MSRLNKILVIATIAASAAVAGQIQIGGTNGLTSSYISTNCPVSNCFSSPTPDNGGQVVPITPFSEVNYTNTLFSNAQNGGSALNAPYTGYSQTAASAGTMTDSANGVTFSMINDGTNSSTGFSNNAWLGNGSASGDPAMLIPIGLYDVTSVYTMLNTLDGLPSPSRDLWIAFDFASTATVASNTTSLTTVTLKLTNSGATANGSGQLEDSLNCTATDGSCPNAANAQAAGSSSVNGIEQTNVGYAAGTSSGTTLSGANAITVLTNQIYSSAYNSGGVGTSGNAVLDDQGFVFNGSLATLAASDYLVDVRIFEVGNNPAGSATALSAITVVTATPEPSTLGMLLAGIGAIGFGIRRRFRQS